LIPEARRLNHEITAFCMGEKGRPGRILSWFLGGKMAYASLNEMERTAPGQFTIEEMEKLMGMCR